MSHDIPQPWHTTGQLNPHLENNGPAHNRPAEHKHHRLAMRNKPYTEEYVWPIKRDQAFRIHVPLNYVSWQALLVAARRRKLGQHVLC